jgi:hypothetical protein
MSKADQIRALREAAATAASQPHEVIVHWHNAPDQIVVIPAPVSTTYQYRDPEKRRVYMREYAKKRRALKAAERKAARD